MDLDLDYHGPRLLEWLYRQPGFEHLYLDITPFAGEEGLPPECARSLAAHLRSRGFIRDGSGLDARPDLMLTPEGVAEVHRVESVRRDPVVRTRSLRRLMVRWLYGHEQDHDMAPPDWSGFIESPGAHIAGGRFSAREVEREAGYLLDKALTSAFSIDQAADGSIRPSLTSEGRECALDFDGDVSAYLSRVSGAAVNQTWIGSNAGNVAVGSSAFTQTVTTGADLGELLERVGAIRQALPVLGLTGDQRAEAERAAVGLEQAARAQRPDSTLVRRLVSALTAVMAKAGTALATTLAADLASEVGRALGH